MSHLVEEMDRLQDTLGKIKVVCDDAVKHFENDTNRVFCQNTIMQAQIILDDSREYSSEWFMKKTVVPTRAKRGLMNFVGSIANALFGVLTEEDSEKYLQLFSELEENQEQQRIIGEKQTSLIKSTFDNVEEFVKTKSLELILMNNEVNEMETMLKSIETYFQWTVEYQQKILRLNNKLNSLIDTFILILMQFERKQAMFLEAIAAGQRSPNSPILIPPELLRKELEDISSVVGKLELKLPLDITPENLALYYQISSPEARIVGNNLLVSFSIPLVSPKSYQLYKATSLPYYMDRGLFAFVVPKHEYFAVHTDKYEFIDINAQELEKCYKINSNYFICKQEFPLFSRFHSNACELNVLLESNKTEQCDTRVANMTNELWIKIEKFNSYIYTIPTTQFVHITCFNETESLHLYGTGILTISPGCKLKSNSMEIIGFQTFRSNIFRNFTHSTPLKVNISKHIETLFQFPTFELPPIQNSELISTGENARLADISTGIRELTEMEENLSKKMSPRALQEKMGLIKIILIILGIIIALIVLKYIYKKFSKAKSTNRAIGNGEIYIDVK